MRASGFRLFILVMLILGLFAFSMFWFDYLGLISVRDRIDPLLRRVGILAPAPLPDADAPDLLDRVRIEKMYDEIDRRQEELTGLEDGLKKREAELVQIAESLQERESALEEREKSFNEIKKQYDNRSMNLRQSADYYVGMPPDKAVERLIQLEDQDLIDILRMTEQIAGERGEASIVAYWISLMPPDRAAVIGRKMLKKPEA